MIIVEVELSTTPCWENQINFDCPVCNLSCDPFLTDENAKYWLDEMGEVWPDQTGRIRPYHRTLCCNGKFPDPVMLLCRPLFRMWWHKKEDS